MTNKRAKAKVRKKTKRASPGRFIVTYDAFRCVYCVEDTSKCIFEREVATCSRHADAANIRGLLNAQWENRFAFMEKKP